MQSPDLDELLSGANKKLGAINWITPSFSAIASFVPSKDMPGKAVVTSTMPHSLSANDSVFIVGYGPKIDGKFTVEEHSHPGVDSSKVFLVDCPDELSAFDTSSARGTLHRAQEYAVMHPDHLSGAATTKLKRLQYEQVVWNQQATPYIEIDVAQKELSDGLSELIAVSEVPKEKHEALREAIAKVPTDAAQQSKALADIKKQFKISYRFFNRDYLALVAKATAFAEQASNFELNPQEANETLDEKPLEILKRRIEILCEMPAGLMSALDNLGGINGHITKLGEYIDSVMPAPKAPKPVAEPEPAQTSPSPKSSDTKNGDKPS